MPRDALRPATEDDLDLLARHRFAMFLDMGGHEPAEFPAGARPSKRWARRMMRADRLAAFLVEKGGEPVASGAVWLRELDLSHRSSRASSSRSGSR